MMRFPFMTTLALSALALGPLPVSAQSPDERLGTYGQWTLHRMSDSCMLGANIGPTYVLYGEAIGAPVSAFTVTGEHFPYHADLTPERVRMTMGGQTIPVMNARSKTLSNGASVTIMVAVASDQLAHFVGRTTQMTLGIDGKQVWAGTIDISAPAAAALHQCTGN